MGGGGGGGEGEPAIPTSILVEGYCKNVHTRMHAHTHHCTYENTCTVHAPKCSYSLACMHACTHICMHACTCRYIKTFIYLHSYMKIEASALYDIEFLESDVRLAEQKSNKKNLSNIFSRRKVILEKLINHKT